MNFIFSLVPLLLILYLMVGLRWSAARAGAAGYLTGLAIAVGFFGATPELLAYAHVFFASSALFGPALKGWSVLYPDFKLTPFVNAYQVGTLFFLTVVPYTIATIIPTWRTSTIDPDSVMRT